MSKLIKTPVEGSLNDGPSGEEQERREVLKKLGRFASVTAPAVAMILAVDGKPARAVTISPGPSGPTGV
jgi:hypothetical protein